MLGADLRNLKPEMKELLLNQDLIAIDQDPECRPPFPVGSQSVGVFVEDKEHAVEPLQMVPDKLLTFVKHLSDNEFVIAYYNLFEKEQEITCIFADLGLPYASGYGFTMKDVFTGEDAGFHRDYHTVSVPGHDCRLYRCRLAACTDAAHGSL